MPKILYFVAEDKTFCSHRLSLVRGIKKAGFEVVVVTKTETSKERIESEGFKVISIELIRKSLNPYKEFCVISKFIQILRREKPDIVHNFAIKPILYGTKGAHYVGNENISIVNTFTGLGYVYTSEDIKAKLLSLILTRSFKKIFKSNNVSAVFQNIDDKNFFVNNKILLEKQAYLIYESINTSHFVPVPEQNGKIVFSFIGRLLWDKGVQEFVTAARMILKKRSDVVFQLVGEPDFHNPSAIPLNKLKDWEYLGIRWLGKQDNIVSVMQNSHVIVLPSYREGFPKVLLEAAACARPIIATDVPGCRELVIHGKTGLLVPKKDISALSEAILLLAHHSDLRNQYGQAGRKFVEENFSEAKLIKNTLELYEYVLSKNYRRDNIGLLEEVV